MISGRVVADFRFDAEGHEYIDNSTGEVLPHITGMLARTGWVDDLWYTEESSERGAIVHRLTADYDLGALDVHECDSGTYRPYLLAHVDAVKALRPTWLAIEQPLAHPRYRFGGRPDRNARIFGLRGPLELKITIRVERSHQIQTALQAILLAPWSGLPAEAMARWCAYYKKTGKYTVEQHRDPRDFDEAYRVIRSCCTY